MFHVPEDFRIKAGPLSSDITHGHNGAFEIPYKEGIIFAIASDAYGWEHVSVSVARHTAPSWELMCIVKDLFWDEEDCVVQFHPPKSQHVNDHMGCLHLWRPVGKQIETPPSFLVGVV